MDRVRLTFTGALTLLCVLPGCAVVDVGVRNPVPGLESVAVAPFFNLSQERTVDGREFALAYYSELQKIPGFEVLPVGVVERAMIENGLSMNSPDDALTLAKILGVDAVVVGAVTDYDPYSPRVGLKVAWYSPQQWLFLPNGPPDRLQVATIGQPDAPMVLRAQSSDLTAAGSVIEEGDWESLDQNLLATADRDIAEASGFLPPRRVAPDATARPAVPQPSAGHPSVKIDGDSGKSKADSTPAWTQRRSAASSQLAQTQPLVPNSTPLLPAATRPDSGQTPSASTVPGPPSPDAAAGGTSLPPMAPDLPPVPPSAAPSSGNGHPTLQPADSPTLLFTPPDHQLKPDGDRRTDDSTVPALIFEDRVVVGSSDFDPHEPLMAYVRMFDSTDARLVSRLADYLELSGETQSGDLEAYMKRSDFFRKFTAHVMISEMLLLHGGESRRRFLLKKRRYR